MAKPDAMTQPSLVMAGHQPIVDVEFSPQGNLYAKTNLVGLDFSYYTAPAKSQAACATLGNPDSENEAVTAKINGIPYSHSSGGQGGMCHEISSEVYATWRAGTCHLFEEDFMTLCPGVVRRNARPDGARNQSVAAAPGGDHAERYLHGSVVTPDSAYARYSERYAAARTTWK